MREWNIVKLGDIAEFSNGINFDKTAYAKGIRLIGVLNFGNRFFPPYEELAEVKKEIVRQNDYLEKDDIVFVRSNGNKELVGRCMLIDDVSIPLTYSGFCIRCRLINKQEYNPIFFTYYFKSKLFRRAMSGTAVGANIQNLSQGRLASHTLKVPNYETQIKIADVLFSYEKYIDNNQKQIKLLEEAAQRLYKEWFVDLKFPGHENVEIVDGVPEGWSFRPVSSFGEVVTGKTPSTSKSEYYGGGIPFVKIPDMHGVVFPIVTETTLSKQGATSQSNKFIPKNSIMVSCIATVGLVNIAVADCQTNQQINSLILKDQSNLYYMYASMKRLKELLDGVGSNGATMTNVNKSKFERIEILYPDEELVKRYQTFCTSIYDKIYGLSLVNMRLSEARDRLLPKLMSGEIEL